jgi:ribosomal protein S18 acetylase RimI-like enzyme
MQKVNEISKKNLDELDNLDGVIAAYFQYMKEKFNRPEYPLKERLRKGIEESKLRIYLASTDNLGPIGFTVVHHGEGRFSFILDLNLLEKMKPTRSLELQKALFNEAFGSLKEGHTIIRFFGELSIELEPYALSCGFTNYKRARMGITRDKIDSLDDVTSVFVSESGFHLGSWTDEMLGIYADLIATQHFCLNHPDGYIFSQYQGYEGCKRLLEEITKSTFGKFTNSQTRILKHGDEHIGMCSVTTLPSNIGYIPEIILAQHYKGRGLGKALLVHSLQHYLKEEPNASTIELDVTLKNTNAANLYNSIGFEELNTYSVFVWTQA